MTQLNALEADLLVAIHTEKIFVNLWMLVALDFDLLPGHGNLDLLYFEKLSIDFYLFNQQEVLCNILLR